MKSTKKFIEEFLASSDNSKVAKQRKFIGTIHRKSQHHSDERRSLTRRYLTLDNAVIRMTAFFVRNGYVGDTCELYHSETGKQLGTIRMSANGTLVTKWLWEK